MGLHTFIGHYQTTIAEAYKLNSPAIYFEVKNVESTGFTPQLFNL